VSDDNQPRRTADAAFAITVLVVAFVTWREASRLAPAPFDSLGPKTFPIALAILLAALALLLLARLALRRRVGAARTSLILGIGDPTPSDYALRPGLAFLAFAATLAYALALSLPGIGFRLATIGFLAVLGIALGPMTPRAIVTAIAIAVIGGAGTDYLFRRVFVVDLP
jgi:hypothetical protein